MKTPKDDRGRLKLPKKVQFWDLDEPDTIIATLHWGWSFYHGEHLGVSGFDTKKEALEAIKGAKRCRCAECKQEMAETKKEKEVLVNAVVAVIIAEILAEEKSF